MQTETWKHVHSGRSVRSCHETNSGAVHSECHLKLHLDETLADRQRICVHVFEYVAREHGPGPVFPCSGRVLRERIMALIDIIDQPLTPLPDQCWNLPGVVLGHECDQRSRAIRIIRVHILPNALWSLEELIFDGGASLEDTGEVFDALLTRIGSLRRAYC